MIRKKFLFLFVGCVIWVSCSEHAFDTHNVVADSNSVLLTKMSSFNDSLIQSRVETRGWVKPGAWKRAQVIAADCGGAWSLGKAGFWAGGLFSPGGAAVGATIGALIGGTCGSYTAYASLYWSRALLLHPLTPQKATTAYASLLNDENVNFEEYVPKTINVDYPILDDNITLMGAKHNVLLKSIMLDDFKENDYKDILSDEEVKVIESKEYKASFDSIMASISVIDGVLVLKGNDVGTKLMNLFYDVFQKYSEDSDDVQFLINKYIDEVNSTSELSDEDKKLVYSSLSVIASSYEFWSNIDL